MADFAFGQPDTNNYRKITRTLYCSKNNFLFEADYMKNEHKSHESLNKNSGIQYFQLFNRARFDAIPWFCQQPE